MGHDDFIWTAWKKTSEKQKQCVAFGICKTENELVDIWDNLGMERVVIDGMAEVRAVKQLKERRPGKVWSCKYMDSPRTDPIWDTKTRTVSVDRTLALDTFFHDVSDRRARLPRFGKKHAEELFPQLRNLVRRTDDPNEKGEVKATWIVRGRKNDHYFHAGAYGLLATEKVRVLVDKKPRDYSGRRRAPRRRGWLSTL